MTAFARHVMLVLGLRWEPAKPQLPAPRLASVRPAPRGTCGCRRRRGSAVTESAIAGSATASARRGPGARRRQREHAPEISMGLNTAEELGDTFDATRGDGGVFSVESVEDLKPEEPEPLDLSIAPESEEV